MIRLPGLCIVCREPVVWNGKRWRSPVRGMGPQHACPPDRPTCGAWMPVARDRCVMRPHGKRANHRSSYALANERAAKRWTKRPPEPHFVDRMARTNLDNGAVKTTITEVQR